MKKQKQYVIIGNSTAAIHCVEGIRSADKEGKITVIADEAHHTYGRPLISYYLYGKTDLEHMKYRPNDWYEKNAVETKLGVKATKIDAEKKVVETETGEKIPYDKLLVATGSRPFVPPMPGLERVKNKYSFMKLDDALLIERDFQKADDVLIIGAGLIGLKCLEGIANRVKSVTVVDMANRILPSILDEEGSAVVQSFLEEWGVRFCLNDSVAAFDGDQATLKSGKALTFDKLVLAVGVRANTELVAEAGGKCERGILTDHTMATTLKDVYAAGDCATSYDITTGTNRVLALLPNAAYQGKVAGLNMAGKAATFDNAIPMNAMGLFGLHMITAGVYEGECYTERSEENYKKLFYRNDKLQGYILIGDVARAGIYTSLIRNQTPLSSVDFDLLKVSPQLAAFSKEYREEKLARRV
jgi:NAD(P)H-nitrite reductase large subunit